MARKRKLKPHKKVVVILQCQNCGSMANGWELINFMGQLGKEYKKRGSVLQSCSCRDGWNEEHVIVGIREEKTEPRTPGQVFARYKRMKGR